MAPAEANFAPLRIEEGGSHRGRGAQSQLAPSLTLKEAVAIIVGTIVGSGIFASPGVVLARTGTPLAALGTWIVGGLLSACGALCYAELGLIFPRSGGEIVYLQEAWGSLASFLFAWTNAVVTRPASLAIIALVFGSYLCRAFGLDGETSPFLPKLLAVCCLLAATVMAVASTRLAARVLTVVTGVKVLVLVGIGLTGIVYLLLPGDRLGTGPFLEGTGTGTSAPDLGLALIATMWSFDGWNNLNYSSSELSSPWQLKRAIVIGVPVVVGLYVVVNVAYFATLSSATVATSDAVATDMAVAVLGKAAGTILMPLCVAVSTFGAVLGSVFSGSRLTHAAASDALLPAWLACVLKRRSYPSQICGRWPRGRHRCCSRFVLGCIQGVDAEGDAPPSVSTSPAAALVCQTTLACGFLLPGSFENLVDTFGFASWVFYLATVGGLLRLRRTRPDIERSFRVPIVLPILFCVVAVGLVISPLIAAPIDSAVALCFIACGVPVWYYRVHRRVRSVLCCDFPCCDSVSMEHEEKICLHHLTATSETVSCSGEFELMPTSSFPGESEETEGDATHPTVHPLRPTGARDIARI